MFFIFAWCLKDEESFARSVPLHEIAESRRRHGSTLPLKAVMLEGFDRLSEPYRQRLAASGLELVDFTNGFQEVLATYPNIVARYSPYERNCFLRWIALQRLLSEMPAMAQVWHIDGDVIFTASIDSIAADTASKTFMLQGCPVLVSISHPSWFSAYASELRALDADIDGYSHRAHEMKPQLGKRDRELCNSSLYRNPIGSDQDFLQYLVSAGLIPQDPSESIFRSEFYYIQNPLTAKNWDSDQPSPGEQKITAGTGGEICKGKRKIPFIHYQGDFTQYCNTYLALDRLGLARFTPRYIAVDGTGAVLPAFRFVSKLLKKIGFEPRSRSEIISETFKVPKNRTEPRIVEILNHINFRDS